MDRLPLTAWLSGALAVGKEIGRMVLRHPVFGVVAVPLDAEGRVVMMRRRDTGTFCLPGGSVEWGETIETALGRELLEETGYTLARIGRVVGLYSSPTRDPRMHAITLVVEAEVTPPAPMNGAGPPLNPLEVIEVRAFALDDIPAALAFDTRRMIDDWQRRAAPIID
jgi:8-oxo-dGTP diphosphatase